MKTYRVVPIVTTGSWKVSGWKVKRDNFFGGFTLAKFSERQEAIDCVKRIGDKNRPSKVLILDNKGHVVSDWEYGARPRVRG